jgi:release factor glutamine methyltransferase
VTQPVRPEDGWTYQKLLDWTTEFLGRKGSASPLLDTQVLMAQAFGCKRIDLYARSTDLAPEEGRARLRELVKQRAEGCPVAYLVGRKEFFSLEFEVDRSVLIPRPDSEWVVTECLRLAQGMDEVSILDLGTGSGNLAVTLAKRKPRARVTAVDLSPQALEVARRNAQKHSVAERILFLQGDLFAPLPAGELFDFVVSNPPYIPTADIATLEKGVRDYEPHQALDGGPDGFAVFDRIVEGARNYLRVGGHLLVEIGSPQEATARAHIEAIPGYELARTILDGSNHPRVLRATWRGGKL